MSSSEPSSPSSTLETPTLTTENEIHDESDVESISNNTNLGDSDPWAFLEKELEEFKRIVAELEQLKLQNCKPGNLNIHINHIMFAQNLSSGYFLPIQQLK